MKHARDHILGRLSSSSRPVSGDVLAAELNLSRAGIWKHIQALKKQGAEITAKSGQGYMLTSEVFSSATLSPLLTGKIIGQGSEDSVAIVEETESTNRDLMQQAEQGADEGRVLFAKRQRGGRGRLGRVWHTLPGSLACSVLLRPELPPEQVPQLSLLTAVALKEALASLAPDIRIKWPNDILYHGAKVAGILTEMRAEPGRVHAVVLGFGINLYAPAKGWPATIRQQATDISSIVRQPFSRLNLAAAVLNSLDAWYQRYLQQGFEPVRRAWWQAHAASGQQVRVHDGRHYIEGIAKALDNDGAMLLKTKQGTRRIIAGDLELL